MRRRKAIRQWRVNGWLRKTRQACSQSVEKLWVALFSDERIDHLARRAGPDKGSTNPGAAQLDEEAICGRFTFKRSGEQPVGLAPGAGKALAIAQDIGFFAVQLAPIEAERLLVAARGKLHP